VGQTKGREEHQRSPQSSLSPGRSATAARAPASIARLAPPTLAQVLAHRGRAIDAMRAEAICHVLLPLATDCAPDNSRSTRGHGEGWWLRPE
jgi:hypothetical protein